jgi:hypothetical protein
MKVPYRSRRVGRQFFKNSQPIQNLLPVGLENLPPQAGRRPRSLLEHDALDALLRQREAKHGSAPSRANDDDFSPFHHFQSP